MIRHLRVHFNLKINVNILIGPWFWVVWGYYKKGDYEKAAQYFKKAKDQFSLEKMETLANCYEDFLKDALVKLHNANVLDQPIEGKVEQGLNWDWEVDWGEEDEDEDEEEEGEGEGEVEHEKKGEEEEEKEGEESEQVFPRSVSSEYSKFSSSINFFLEEAYQHQCYRGYMDVGVKISKAFIPIDCEINNFDQLQWLCSSSKHMLYIDFPVYNEALSAYLLVVEGSYAIGHFFHLEHDKLLKENVQPQEKQWWNYIARKYHKIFRDIVFGMLFLYSEKLTCDLSFNLYVSDKGQGKILPSLDAKKKNADADADDGKQLVQKMRTIITFPFPKKNAEDDFGLPNDLKNLFKSLFIPMSFVPASFRVFHPYFWTWEEGMMFMRELKAWMKMHNIGSQCDLLLANSSLMMWSSKLQFSEVYYKIWEKGNPKVADTQPVLGPGEYKANKYKYTIDFVRFVGAVYAHVNDSEYDNARIGKKKFSNRQIEGDLRGKFPNMYCDLYGFVCECVEMGYVHADTLAEFGR